MYRYKVARVYLELDFVTRHYAKVLNPIAEASTVSRVLLFSAGAHLGRTQL